MNEEKIKYHIKRIADSSSYSYEETELILIKLLEEIGDTGELIKLLGTYRIMKG